MKIAFLCSSLAPGRDGVGDYARRLAAACAERGLECRLLALNDEHVSSVENETQDADGRPLDCVRLPSRQSWAERIAHAARFVAAFSPDWLSWQIVPYGFHPKGIIPAEILQPLAALGRGRRTHAMLHELWIGLSRGESLKNRIYGRLQRRALMKCLRALAPTVVATSNPTYQAVLADEHCVALQLPLFGNIPVHPAPPPAPSDSEWTGVIFGTVHAQFKARPCFPALIAGARASGRTLRILGIGRVGTYGGEMIARLRDDFGETIRGECPGEKSPEEVSRLLRSADFGIGTHPWALLGKSGAVAAMLDHGLPVIVPRDDWKLRHRPFEAPAIAPLVTKLADAPPELMARWVALKRPASARLPGIADAFLSQLGVGVAQPSSSA